MERDTYGNIHVAVNLIILLLLEGLCLWGLWKNLDSFVTWVIVAIIVFLAVAYLGHRWIPKLTGPVVDALIKEKIE